MPNLNNAYQWAIGTCNAPNVGYSMAYRNQQTIGGITYYDCSSFIWYALIGGGFDVVTAYGGETWAFVTSTMGRVLLNLGFISIPVESEWLAGDILVRNNSYGEHTEMVYQGRRTMGAHSARYALADQVSIKDTDDNPATWDACYRYGAGALPQYEWVIGEPNQYFNDAQMVNNAYCIAGFFLAKGWTLQAIAGLLGNIEQESTMNPALLEQGVPYPNEGKGTGLVQWTPSGDRYTDINPLHLVFDALGLPWGDYSNGTYQCEALYAEFEQSTGLVDRGIEPQWYQTSAYPISWKDWSESTDSPAELASAFMRNYERPYLPTANEEKRRQDALEWFDVIKNALPWIPQPSGKSRKGMPIWMMCKYGLF